MRAEAGRFLASGAFVTIAGTIILVALMHVMPYPLSYTIVFVLSVITNIQLHSRYVFRKSLNAAGVLRAIGVQLILYFVGLSGLALFVQVFQLGPALSPLANLFLCTPINFLITRLVFHVNTN